MFFSNYAGSSPSSHVWWDTQCSLFTSLEGKKIKIYPVRLSFGEKINHKMHLGLHHCAVLETVGAYTRRSASSQQSLGVLRSWTGVYAYTSNIKISVKPMTTEGSLSNSVCMQPWGTRHARYIYLQLIQKFTWRSCWHYNAPSWKLQKPLLQSLVKKSQKWVVVTIYVEQAHLHRAKMCK